MVEGETCKYELFCIVQCKLFEMLRLNVLKAARFLSTCTFFETNLQQSHNTLYFQAMKEVQFFTY